MGWAVFEIIGFKVVKVVVQFWHFSCKLANFDCSILKSSSAKPKFFSIFSIFGVCRRPLLKMKTFLWAVFAIIGFKVVKVVVQFWHFSCKLANFDSSILKSSSAKPKFFLIFSIFGVCRRPLPKIKKS